MLTRVTGDDRAHLLKLLPKRAFCACGEPAVVLYQADIRFEDGSPRYYFRWARCGFCPGVREAQGLPVEARPLDCGRDVLKLLGDEDAFLAAVRLGYRPPSYNTGGVDVDGEVLAINTYLWDLVDAQS